jgi:hypothetical protein
MARKVFYSFHYQPDCSRAAQVRNMGVVEGNQPASDNDWESIQKGGDAAIKRWIAGQLNGKSCSVVLIGAETAGRKWINYEIETSWTEGKGLLGIYIHRLKDFSSQQSQKGSNPFDEFTLSERKIPLSSIVKAYDPPHLDSKAVYSYIHDNLPSWIEEAIQIRAKY